MFDRLAPAVFTAIPLAAASMCMCSMSGAPLRETDGGFARFST